MTEILTPAQEDLLRQTLAKYKLELFRPYPKQIEFCNASAEHREILNMSANQIGKTFCAAALTAMHATGKYFDWYTGRRFKKAPVIWCAGTTGAFVRDTIQKLLIGDVSNPGTGFLPEGSYEVMMGRGVPDGADTIIVNHVSGAKSRITFKSYDQQREKFQGDTVDFVWLDEEPDESIYFEALTRTNATGGYLIMTFTPLRGMSKVVLRFLSEKSVDRYVVNMTINDVPMTPEKRRQLISSYPEHERDARINGIPVLGSGAIFPVKDEDIMCDPFTMENVPFYWMEIAALDFGWDHPTAAVKALYNPQDDIIYITNTYRRKEATPLQHAAALKPWGNLPFAWPHDGLQHDKGSGVPLKEIYRQQGLNMLPDNARFEDGSNGVEAGLAEMLMRMETGRWKVFRHLTDWFEEKRLYHRRDGKVWKENDDLMACLHPDTEVITNKGKMRIVDLVDTEGMVLTSYGKWTEYRNCRMTRADAELVEVTYSDGHKLFCTPDHLLKSNEGFWVKAIDSMGMECHCALPSSSIGKIKFNMTRAAQSNQIGKLICNIFSMLTKGFYRFYMGGAQLFSRGSAMLAGVIISFKKFYSYFSKFSPIVKFFSSGPVRTFFLNKGITKPFNPTIIRAESFTGMATMGGSGGSAHFAYFDDFYPSAFSAAKNLFSVVAFPNDKFFLATRTYFFDIQSNCFAFKRAINSKFHSGWETGKNILTGWTLLINQMAHRLCYHINNIKVNNKNHILRVSAVQTVKQKSDVYCMEVPETSAFSLANGAIVHNCSRYLQMCLRFAKRVNKPRAVINGYPHDEEKQSQSGKPETYQPLGHKYIDQILGIK